MENCFKSFTKSLQEAHRLHAVLAPSTCCVLFYLSFAIRKRFYICLIKVLEDTLYLMFYEYKACIIHPPAAKKACFWVYLCGNKRAQWNYSRSIAAGGHSKHLWFLLLNGSYHLFIVQVTIGIIPSWEITQKIVFPSFREDT